jgi:hypothetical protein
MFPTLLVACARRHAGLTEDEISHASLTCKSSYIVVCSLCAQSDEFFVCGARRHAGLTEEEILWAIYSISDNNSYLLFNRCAVASTNCHTGAFDASVGLCSLSYACLLCSTGKNSYLLFNALTNVT